MPDCSFDGNADLYGLGIRIGFYLQWCTTILANFVLVKEEIVANSFAFALYISAVFLNLVVQTFRTAINPLDIYITNLLCFGSQFFLVPLFLWRLVTCGDPFLDPTRWSVITPGLFLRLISVLLWIASSTFQLWFWIQYLPFSDPSDCEAYGFFFVKARLNESMLRSVNITLLSLHEVILLLGFIEYLARKRRHPYLENKTVRTTERHWRVLQFVRSAILTTVAMIIFVATELCIKWNSILGVNTLEPSGQMIPLFISIGIFLRVLWVCIGHYNNKESGRDALVTPDHAQGLSPPDGRLRKTRASKKDNSAVQPPKGTRYKDYTVMSPFAPVQPADPGFGR